MTVTIKDVAKAANVSVSTVSLVINDSNLVKAETRYKVLKTIEELNYKPNEYARSLVTKKKKIIGVAYPTNESVENLFSFDEHVNTYLTELLPHIQKEANKSNYSMQLEHFNISGPKTILPSIMDSRKVDGMLITGGIMNENVFQKLLEVNIPTVLIGSRHDEFDYVDTNPGLGIYKGTKYLIENGHKDILFINGPKTSQSSSRKIKGFCTAMEEFGLPIKEGWIFESEYSGASAYKTMKSIWEKGIRPTAIIVGFDCIAIGALRYLYEMGVKCPDDISIVGFEDNILADFSYPPLTTINIHKKQIGIEACRTLFNRINKPNAQRVKLIIEPGLIIRDSVKRYENKGFK